MTGLILVAKRKKLIRPLTWNIPRVMWGSARRGADTRWPKSVVVFDCRFVCKNNGVIFENQLLQIGLKSEYRQNLGEYSSSVCNFSG